MSTGVTITLIICGTILTLAVISNVAAYTRRKRALKTFDNFSKFINKEDNE